MMIKGLFDGVGEFYCILGVSVMIHMMLEM